MEKILCLGNNTEDTDVRTSRLAEQNNSINHGLISELDGGCIPEIQTGYYHSSVYDLQYSQLVELALGFDKVVVLDQDVADYSHPDAFYKTVRLAQQLSQTMPVQFLNPEHTKGVSYFQDLVNNNPSFCIFPFIELLANNGETTVCCRSSRPITRLADLKNFATDPNYQIIRKKMIAGDRLPEHCAVCYKLEGKGIVSARMQETVEWANRLNLRSVQDLLQIQQPVYYEVRASNICNLQCRSCGPEYSHLIAKEYKLLGINKKDFSNIEYTNFDFINFENLQKLYVAGGEPTAMIEFYDFLDRCIAEHKVDFELVINTNGTKINNRFKQQLKHFSNVSFIFSVDGYDRVNHYVRWPSHWNSIIENMHYVKNARHSISVNVTVSIYNMANLYKLLKFFDDEFPGMLVHCSNCESSNDTMSAFRFPFRDIALQNLTEIKQLKCYKNDGLLQSFIDALAIHYDRNHSVDIDKLKLFFEFNDKLDRSRNVTLKDYLPELEQARLLLDNN